MAYNEPIALTTTTYTPVLTFGGASVGITYAVQNGSYIRLGSMVFVNIAVTLSSKGSSTGAASISLPVTPALTCEVILKYGNITFTGDQLTAQANFSAGVQFLPCTSAVPTSAALIDTAFVNNSTFLISGCYFV